MPFIGSGQGATPERLQNKIVITAKCLPAALESFRTRLLLPGKAFQQLKGSSQEKLHNKIVIIRKCLSEALARGSPQGKAPEQDCYCKQMPSKGFGQGVAPP